MEKKKVTYNEIARVAIKSNRDLVLSKTNDGRFVLAQQLGLSDNESGNKINFFLKGAIHFDTEESLVNARDMISMAIDAIGVNSTMTKSQEVSE